MDTAGIGDSWQIVSLVKKHGIKVPISIHVEHDLGGAEHGKSPNIAHTEVFKSIKRDLDYVRRMYKEA